MRTLIAFEFKKLLNRKAVWVALALALALTCYGMKPAIESQLNGYVQGMRDACAPFEGQALTDAVAAQARAMLLRYAADHPDAFTYPAGEEQNQDALPMPNGFTDYASGFWQITNKLADGDTVEKRHSNTQSLQSELDHGYSDDGKQITEEVRQNDLQQIEANSHPFVVHYAAGWEELHFETQTPGIYLFMLMIVGLTVLFGSERVSNMDNVLLCAKARRQGIVAKLVVSAVYTLALCVLLFGLEIAAVALTYGLDGGQYPIRDLSGIFWNLTYGSMNSAAPVGSAYLPAFLLTALSAVACALLVALASSLFRHPLATLGAAIAVLAVQFLPLLLSQGYQSISLPPSVDMSRSLTYIWAAAMPANQLSNMSNITTMIANGATVWPGVFCSALLIAAALFTPSLFCRRRRL